MPGFQVTVLIIAIILLILALTFIGISLKNSNTTANTNNVWPPPVADCPDYFAQDICGSDIRCINTHHLGTCNLDKASYSVSFSDPKFTGADGSCNKYTWAKGCNLSWDGITYGVPNPCGDSS